MRPNHQSPAPSPALLAFCRSGFEPELAAELTERSAAAGITGYARTERGSGLVQFISDDRAALARALPWRALIFARQVLAQFAELRDLDTQDRITPLLAALSAVGATPCYGRLLVEHSDADAAKPLASLARGLGNALRPVLRKRGWLTGADDDRLPRLHVVLQSGTALLLAEGDTATSPDWPGGIPRLRMLREAPSRSALKLEEALQVLLDADERERWLKPGMRAADLGAAPGGWSWVLARQHLRVTAIDNGPLAESALATGLIEHQRADGFRWHPNQAIDWMVCDMVEQPSRVAERMATWFREGWCRRAIFNLKLPMKKRWQETRQCLDAFASQAGLPLEIRAKQLYHDREEITVYAGPGD